MKFVCSYRDISIWRKDDKYEYHINLDYFKNKTFKTITDCEYAIDKYLD